MAPLNCPHACIHCLLKHPRTSLQDERYYPECLRQNLERCIQVWTPECKKDLEILVNY